MKIELYYFDGCPSHEEALENLKAVLAEEQIETEVDVIRVESPEHAQILRFQGSPSIVVNGVDLEHKQDPPLFGCRIYHIEGKLTGTPSRTFIREKLTSLL